MIAETFDPTEGIFVPTCVTSGTIARKALQITNFVLIEESLSVIVGIYVWTAGTFGWIDETIARMLGIFVTIVGC